MDAGEDVGEAPAAGRPAPLMEVLPQVGLGRHGGIGYELVLASALPQGYQEAETSLPAFLKREKREGGGEGEEQGHDQEGDGPGNS